jgi:hypothetical protein
MINEVPDGSIVISPKEFYDGVKADVSEIKTSISDLTNAVGTLPTRVERLELRITALESRVIWASGFAAAVGLASGYIIPQLVK